MNRTPFRLLLLVSLLASGPALAQQERQATLNQELPKLKTIYRTTTIKSLGLETPLSGEYFQLLTRYLPLIRTNLHDWPQEPGVKYHKRDGSEEHAVRQNASVALALAVIASSGDLDELNGDTTRVQAQVDAIALIRYLSVTHAANFLPTGDGKKWGDHWQSAFWAATAGQAAWLLWDKLPDDTKVMAARMIIHEANRFNTRPPDNGEWSDTKAEENAWNSEVIALAACMFPQHPNATVWRERAIVWMINSFTTQADHSDASMVEGKRVRDWVTTTNLHSDFTLENHDRVHPDYLSTFSLNLRNALFYKLAGLKTPDAAFHHALDCFRVFEQLTATNGSLFYVNGQDWWPHRHELPTFVGGLTSVLLRDPNAACMERMGLAWLKKLHSRFEDGRAFDPREVNYPNVEEELMARYAELYLAHRLFGDGPSPVSPEAFQAAQCGTRIFEAGGFVTHRTPEKFVSFAWVHGAMGLVYPSDDTWFTAPSERGLVGRIEVDGVRDTPPKLEARDVSRLQLSGSRADGGFAFVGKFSRCEGKVQQTLAVISLPAAPVIYVEQLRALEDVNVRKIVTGTVSILNEDARPMGKNQRRIWTAEGASLAHGAANEPADFHLWKTTWANVDDELSLFAQASGQMAYTENHAYQRSRLEQELAANYVAEAGPKKAGKIISELVLALAPNAPHTQPMDLRVERPGENVFSISFGRWLVAVNLGELQIKAKEIGRNFK